MNFNISSTPSLFFGEGKFKLIETLDVYKKSKGIILITGQRSFIGSESFKWLTQTMQSDHKSYLHFTVAKEPTPGMIDQIVDDSKIVSTDLIIGIGGGSVIDTAKAVSAMLKEEGTVLDYIEGVGTKKPSGRKIPMIAVPTTSGTGSEATKNAVISEVGVNGFKRSLRHDAYVPNIAIIDPELLISCPKLITGSSGMDALTQLLESYLSTAANSFTDALALSGIEAIGKSLIHLCSERSEDISEEKELRSQMAYAAYLSGITLANAGLSTVHGFASSVGGRFDIPHGILCGTLLAETLDISLDYLIEHQMTDYIKKYEIAGKVLLASMLSRLDISNDEIQDAKSLIMTLRVMIEKIQLPLLSEFNVKEEDLRALAAETSNKNNPALLSVDQLIQILIRRL